MSERMWLIAFVAVLAILTKALPGEGDTMPETRHQHLITSFWTWYHIVERKHSAVFPAPSQEELETMSDQDLQVLIKELKELGRTPSGD